MLLSAFLAICLTIGYNQCYGVFQEYYLSPSQELLVPAPSSMTEPPSAELAFVGTLGSGLTWAGSIFVNPLISRIDYFASMPSAAPSTGAPQSRSRRAWHQLLCRLASRHITILGAALMSLGFLLASFGRTVSYLLLTQGLLYGIGSSLLYFPILGPAPEYFTAHRATAMGMILSGGGVGGLVLGPVLRALLARIGAAWTLRVLAAISLVVGLPVALAVPASRFPAVPAPSSSGSATATSSDIPSQTALNDQTTTASHANNCRRQGSHQRNPPATVASGSPTTPPAPPPRRRTRLPASLLFSPPMVLSALTAFVQSAGAQLPLTFIPSYSVALGLDAGTGAALLAAANAINAAARVVAGYAGDRLGRLNALVAGLFVTTAAVLGLWLGSVVVGVAGGGNQSDGSAGAVRLWFAFIAVYSVASGGYYALFPATIADVFGIRSYAAVNGFIYFIRGLGTMVGSPVGGVLLGKGMSAGEVRVKGYARVVYWDGALMLASVVFIIGLRWADAARRGWMWRA